MKVKHKTRGTLGWASKLNPSAVSPAEMIVTYIPDGDASSEYVADWDPADPTLNHDALWRFLESREP